MSRTKSEMVQDTKLYGYNLIKVAKYINFTVGICLVAAVAFEFVQFKFLNVYAFTMTLFEG